MNYRYAYPWWKEKEIDSETKRLQGLCPLTPEEIALVLKALGFSKDTLIYIASGEIYGGERRLAALKAAYPNLVSASSIYYFHLQCSLRQVFIFSALCNNRLERKNCYLPMNCGHSRTIRPRWQHWTTWFL